MNDAFLMTVLNRSKDLRDYINSQLLAKERVLHDIVEQFPSLSQLTDYMVEILVLIKLDDFDYVRVVRLLHDRYLVQKFKLLGFSH
jgi:hypothetical protein